MDRKLRKYRTLNFSMRKRQNFDYADKAADCILTQSFHDMLVHSGHNRKGLINVSWQNHLAESYLCIIGGQCIYQDKKRCRRRRRNIEEEDKIRFMIDQEMACMRQTVLMVLPRQTL